MAPPNKRARRGSRGKSRSTPRTTEVKIKNEYGFALTTEAVETRKTQEELWAEIESIQIEDSADMEKCLGKVKQMEMGGTEAFGGNPRKKFVKYAYASRNKRTAQLCREANIWNYEHLFS